MVVGLKPILLATSEGYTSLSGLEVRFIIAVSCYEIYISVMNATARLADLDDVHYFNRVSTRIALSAVHCMLRPTCTILARIALQLFVVAFEV